VFFINILTIMKANLKNGNVPAGETGRKAGRPGIVDEFAGLPVSRQRKWQLRQMAKGGCRICGQTAITKGYCLKHLVRERDYSAERFGYQRANQNCKSRLLEKFVKTVASRWKYQIVSARANGADTNRSTQDILIEHWAGLGWELTAAIPQPDGDTWLYFKQPIPTAEAPAETAACQIPPASRMPEVAPAMRMTL